MCLLFGVLPGRYREPRPGFLGGGPPSAESPRTQLRVLRRLLSGLCPGTVKTVRSQLGSQFTP